MSQRFIQRIIMWLLIVAFIFSPLATAIQSLSADHGIIMAVVDEDVMNAVCDECGEHATPCEHHPGVTCNLHINCLPFSCFSSAAILSENTFFPPAETGLPLPASSPDYSGHTPNIDPRPPRIQPLF